MVRKLAHPIMMFLLSSGSPANAQDPQDGSPGPMIQVHRERCVDLANMCGCQHVVQHRSEPGRFCPSHRKVSPAGRYLGMKWSILPIPPNASRLSVTNRDVSAAITNAAREWKKQCKLSAADDIVRILEAPPFPEAESGMIIFQWQDLDKIRNSAFSLREAIACFDPLLDDSCTLVGGRMHFAHNPELILRQGDLEAPQDAFWLRHGIAHKTPESSLCLDDALIHEYGHTLGLDNYDDPRSIMYEDLCDSDRVSVPAQCDCQFLRVLLENLLSAPGQKKRPEKSR